MHTISINSFLNNSFSKFSEKELLHATGDTGATGATGPTGPGVPLQLFLYQIASAGDTGEFTLGSATFRMEFISTSTMSLSIYATLPALTIDLFLFTINTGGTETFSHGNYVLTPTALLVAPTISTISEGTTTVLLRQQDPDTFLWTLYKVHIFASGGGLSTTVWVEEIYTNQPL